MSKNKTNSMDIPTALRNILMFLQRDPSNYKKFGVYWWAVKAALKQAGYTERLYLLKNYRDEEQASRIPAGDLPTTLQRAIAEWRFNAGFGRLDGAVEDDDGEIMTVWDDDAGF